MFQASLSCLAVHLSCLLARRLHRNILADKPRVTKFNIDWDSERATSGLQSGMEVDS